MLLAEKYVNEKKFLALKCFSCKKNTLNLSVRVAIMLKSAIFILELLFLSFVHCQRYYAFVETLFVIDKRYFPTLSEMTYEKYVQTIVFFVCCRFFNHLTILILELKSLFQK